MWRHVEFVFLSHKHPTAQRKQPQAKPTITAPFALGLGFALMVVASTLLFIGVFSVFVMIYRIGKEPE